jgi:histidyl-tRNA synthetase
VTRYQRVTGMKDVLLEEQPYWRHLLGHVQRTADLFGYQRLDTPLIEFTDVFARGVGEGTDIVEKEMYTWQDLDGNSISLRPEFTAGIIRAYVENGMHTFPTPLKVWTVGPLFRHEKPAAGRYRQHSQFDIEVIGEQDPAVDSEVISVAWQLFTDLGFHGLRLLINSTGCPRCKPDYVAALRAYFEPFQAKLPEVDQMRLRKNPLRILDTKEVRTQALLTTVPRITDHLCDECADHFERLKAYLDELDRPYQVNFRLVRGLDYYTKTVFEIKADGLGSQDTICGGGRYDGLAELLGGSPTPAIGFGAGIERIILALQHLNLVPPPLPAPQVLVAYLGEPAKLAAVTLVERLRRAEIGVLLAFGDRSLKAQLKSADRAGVAYAIIVGEEELATGRAQVRDMASSEQVQVRLSRLEQWLSARLVNDLDSI